jgi:hypothetical protein
VARFFAGPPSTAWLNDIEYVLPLTLRLLFVQVEVVAELFIALSKDALKRDLAALLGVLAVISQAYAWGDEGHKTVCEIAMGKAKRGKVQATRELFGAA